MTNQTKQSNNIILSKQDYLRLKHEAQAYRNLAVRLFELPLRDSIEEIVADFRTTKLYTDKFLKDLEDGLHKSSYVKKHAYKTIKVRS